MNSGAGVGIEQHDADVDLIQRGRQPRRGGVLPALLCERIHQFLPQQAGDGGRADRGHRHHDQANQVGCVVAGAAVMAEENSAAQPTAMVALTIAEARPLSEAAKATMQMNSGIGLGTMT